MKWSSSFSVSLQRAGGWWKPVQTRNELAMEPDVFFALRRK